MAEKTEKLEKLREEVRLAGQRIADAKDLYERRTVKLKADFEARMDALTAQLEARKARLKEAENTQVVAQVDELSLTPEQVGALLALVRTGRVTIPDMSAVETIKGGDAATETEGGMTDEEQDG